MMTPTTRPRRTRTGSTHRALVAARVRYGVLSPADAALAGLTDSQLRRLVERGVLERRARGVLVAAASPRTWEQEVMVAVTAAGPGALASHETAAALQGLVDRRPDRIEVVMARWDRARMPFTVHESTDLLPEDADAVGGIPVTSAVRTVVDLGASARWLVESALERGIRRELFTLADVARLVERVARRGRRGVGVIRPLVEERLHWDGLTESELEDLFRKAWGRRRPQPIPQHVIVDEAGAFVCRADFAFPEQRVRVELDSEAFHMDRPTFRKDRAVQNRTEQLGWRTLRYTWWDLVGRPADVVAEVLSLLA